MPREEIFLTSKLWNTHQPNVAEGLQKSLDALGVDYLDLYVSWIVPGNRQIAPNQANNLLTSSSIGLFDWSP